MGSTAIVMNMYYTGLGIARSLGEHGIKVSGLTARRGVYGNFSRYVRTLLAPDSRHQPEELLAFLLGMKSAPGEKVIFPTRDDDVIFLDRFRRDLEPFFTLAVPDSDALTACLNKWETHQAALRSGVPVPKCWLVENDEDLRRVGQEATFPCVMKPLLSQYWRRGGNWQIVDCRKVIGVSSLEQMHAEYATISRADKRVVIQEMIPGGDERLVIVACYLDRESKFRAGFNTQKLLQTPAVLGTGCIVQTADHPELLEPTLNLLQEIRFTGIAEVEYKWDCTSGLYKLIEINPRPWDQHRLGIVCGVNLPYVAYCDYAGLPPPVVRSRFRLQKWVAEDVFLTTALRMLWAGDPALAALFRLARGERTYAIWSARDPLPFFVWLLASLIPDLLGAAVRRVWSVFGRILPAIDIGKGKASVHETDF
jgi:predicted ATP-grasp superfamily ATP-dependent carboligase